jgi:hypothetical protein
VYARRDAASRTAKYAAARQATTATTSSHTPSLSQSGDHARIKPRMQSLHPQDDPARRVTSPD